MKDQIYSFKDTLAYMFFLIMSADKVAHFDEFILLNKILKFESIEKKSFMMTVDQLSQLNQTEIYTNGIRLLKSLSKSEQEKCLTYMLLIAKADGTLDLKENSLIHQICTNELDILFESIAAREHRVARSLHN